MAIPVPDLTWGFDTNNAVQTGSAIGDVKEILIGLKTAMLASGVWTVSMSCGYYDTGGGRVQVAGAADYWDTTESLVWNVTGSARSWIVLRNSNFFGAGKHLEVILECCWHSVYRTVNVSVHYSPTGDYAGGNTTTLPSGTTNVGPLIAPSIEVTNFIQREDSKKRIWNYAYSTDGKCSRFWIFQEGYCTTILWFERMKNPVGGLADEDTFVVLYVPDASVTVTVEKMSMANFCAASTYAHSYVSGSGSSKYYMTVEYAGGYTLNNMLRAPNADDGSQLFLPIGLVTVTNVAWAYGRNGELYDSWWGSLFKPMGTTYPDDGSRDFLQIGPMIVPWDGSKPRIYL